MPMIDDWLLSLIYAAWLASSTMPMALMLGSSCSPCCGGCGVADGKPRTDPVNEGTWVPSGTWRGVGGVTWSFTANPGDDSGETWFFYGSESTSNLLGNADPAEQQDWGNLCNWYSNKTTSPSATSGLPAAFDKRATRLPPDDAIVHVYSQVDTSGVGARLVKHIYFWFSSACSGSPIESTDAAHDSPYGTVFLDFAKNGFGGVINGGAAFYENAENQGTVNDAATFNQDSTNASTVNSGAIFNDSARNIFSGVVNDAATFNNTSRNEGVINDSALFFDSATNFGADAIVNGGAIFYGDSSNTNLAVVNDGAEFYDTSDNGVNAVVNDGAEFYDTTQNASSGTVNGGATFNDAACSLRVIGSVFVSPCSRKFVTHPTDVPTCNGTAPNGCFSIFGFFPSCGCG